MVSTIGLFLIVAGAFVTILVCAIMPSTTGSGYASNATVWSDWVNTTGYTSNGFVFLAGMLNGAYAIGGVDVTTHLSEEIPNPRRNVPKAMLSQWVTGFALASLYLIALFYSINDFGAIADSDLPIPLVAIYQQSTNSRAGAMVRSS